MKRNNFLKTVAGTGLLVAASPLLSFTNPLQNDPQLDKELVATFVGAGHGDLLPDIGRLIGVD